MIPAVNFRYFWDVLVNPRLGRAGHAPDAYVWGGSFSADDIDQGTDCSGAVSAELSAMVRGPAMIYQRQFYTGTFAGVNPGDHGPWGGVDDTRNLVCIARPNDAAPGAAMIIAIRQMADPTDAHMICSVPTSVGGPWTTIEMGGPPDNYHLGVTAIDDPEFDQWFYLPGPILDDASPPPPPPVSSDSPLVAALKANGSFSAEQIRLIQGFSIVEGLNPAGNPTLGFTDAQLGGDTSLVGHVNALAQQFRVRLGAITARGTKIGVFPEGGSDQEQAQWIADIVGQSGLPSDWQGNAQPEDYVQRVVAAMPPQSSPPSPLPLPSPPEDDWLNMPSNQEKLDAIYTALILPVDDSWSSLKGVGQATKYSLVDLMRNTDGSTHVIKACLLAILLDDPEHVELVRQLAEIDLTKYPDRVHDRGLARAVWNKILWSRAAFATPPSTPALAPAYTRPEMQPPAPPPQIVYLPAPIEPPKTNGSIPALEPKDVGDIVGDLYRAIGALHLADALTIQDRATLAATISILQTKNGAQIS